DGHSYHEYLMWQQMKMWETRKTAAPIFSHFGECHAPTGPLMLAYFDLLNGWTDPKAVWLSPPIAWTSRALEIQCSLRSADFGKWLVLSTALHYLLFDLVAGTGVLDVSEFPEAIRGAPVFTEMMETGLVELCSYRP